MFQVVQILEYVNIGVTVLFLLFYLYRFFSLRHFAVTDKYRNRNPKIRMLLCILYFLISIPFLAISIIYGIRRDDDSEFWIIIEGVGEFIDGIILIIQVLVIKAELAKERPYTPIHLIFSLYLTAISIARLLIDIINGTHNTFNIITLAFYAFFLFNALIIFLYWILKRQELPQFEEVDYFNFDQFKNNSSKRLINRNIEISYLKKISQSFHYIRPLVSVERSKFRIILEIYEESSIKDKESNVTEKVENEVLSVSSGVRRTFMSSEHEERLKVISNQIYSSSQIIELYKICGRFDLKQEIAFDTGNLGEIYKNLQLYLEELFGNKKHYLDIILKYFQIPEELLLRFQKELRLTIKGSELDMHAHLDTDAAFISIKIYKQLWIDDHYLFYMDVVAMDSSFDSRPMKRFTDFENLHQKLQALLKRRYGKFSLPELPKKYLFNWDENKITHRRVELEHYLRNLCNDYIIMNEMHEAREVVLNFLLCREVMRVNPQSEKMREFFRETEVIKGQITKHLTNQEYVTYYQFRLVRNGIPVRSIRKRYSDFELLHQALERNMSNTQIYYKFVVLPEKHMYKSGPIRHEKLKAYLNYIITIPDIWKVYDLVSFFHIDGNVGDLDMSGIGLKQENPNFSPNYINNSQDMDEIQNNKLIHESSISSNQRMSALIDELGG